jgi:dienelactone hydrolase
MNRRAYAAILRAMSITILALAAACGPDRVAHGPATLARQPVVPDDEAAAKPDAGAEVDRSTEVWWGTLVLPTDLVDIVVTFRHDGDAVTATFSVPAMKVENLALSEVELGPELIRFTLMKEPPYPPEHYQFARRPGGPVAEGVLELGGNQFAARMIRQDPGAPPRIPIQRPQTPLPPYPYAVRDVTIPAPEDGVLAGTLTIPAGTGPFPAVVLISGSGQQDRDETIYGHRPFRVLADRMTRAGFVVLRTDDRGIGQTRGKLGTLETDIGDGRAAFEWLASQPEVDARRVGILGHSAGGIVAPTVAARTGKVAFVVALAGPGLPGWELVPLQLTAIMDAAGMKPEVVKKLAAAQRAVGKAMVGGKPAQVKAALRASIVDAVVATGRPPPTAEQLDAAVAAKLPEVTDPWTVSFFKTDPRAAWRKVKVPVLALIGERDLQVPAAINLAEITAALKKAGNKDVTTRTLPGLNHLYQHAPTGAVEEYGRIEETFDPATLEAIVSWMAERTRR